jgi:hypothetical protein
MPTHPLFSREAQLYPYDIYRDLRRKGGIHFDPDLRFWLFTTHQAVHHGLASPTLSRATNRPPRPGEQVGVLRAMQEEWFLYNDPPVHTRLRNYVKRAFSARRVEAMRSVIQRVTDELLDDVPGQSSFDLVGTLSYPLPSIVIAEMLGAPPEDRERFKGWSSALADVQEASPSAEVIAAADDAMSDASDYLTALAQERKARPTEDLLSALVEPDEHGSKMTDSELVATCVLLLTAGHETTMNLISNAVVALSDNPEQRAALQADPELIVPAVEEFLRYEAPTQMTGRVVAEDFAFDGVSLKAGQKVLLLIGSANHDEQVFDDPERLDITRKPNNHVGFGYGIHFCTGSALARLEGQVAIPTILRRYPNLTIGEDGPTRSQLSLVRGISTLPVEV